MTRELDIDLVDATVDDALQSDHRDAVILNSTGKKAYSRPAFHSYGPLHQLIRAGTSGSPDGAGGQFNP
jgi:hypothetical protein